MSCDITPRGCLLTGGVSGGLQNQRKSRFITLDEAGGCCHRFQETRDFGRILLAADGVFDPVLGEDVVDVFCGPSFGESLRHRSDDVARQGGADVGIPTAVQFYRGNGEGRSGVGVFRAASVEDLGGFFFGEFEDLQDQVGAAVIVGGGMARRHQCVAFNVTQQHSLYICVRHCLGWLTVVGAIVDAALWGGMFNTAIL